MKILLLSDIPPCDKYTAGLVLAAMVRFVPRDAICCFAVVNAALDVQMTSEFANIPTKFYAKPNESWSWLPRRRLVRKASSLVSLVGELLIEKTVVPFLVRKAVLFGREQKVDRVWAVLQGQTTIRMARAVADELGVPLHTHVWDPFSWWSKANCIDGLTTRRVQLLFDDAIRSSSCVATASEPMAKLYHDRFKVDAVPVISSHSTTIAQHSGPAENSKGPILIGIAGQFYASAEWLQLIKAMRSSNWTICGRHVRIVVLGPQRPPGTASLCVSYLGWKSQPDAALVLSQCDILYCPYPFDTAMEEVSRYSFPSKLVLYLAAGRPIVFHGPTYSAPAQYIASRECGLVAERLSASAIYNALERLVSNQDECRSMALKAEEAFSKDFTLETMQQSFNTFIGASIQATDQNCVTHNHAGHNEDHVDPVGLTISQRYTSLTWLSRLVGSHVSHWHTLYCRKLTFFLRRCALTVPRIRSLHHEIQTLYEEKATLKKRNDLLQEENTRLAFLLRDSPVTYNHSAEHSTQSRPVAIIDSLAANPQFVSRLYPGVNALVLTNLLKELWPIFTGDNGTDQSPSRKTHLTVGTISYALMPHIDGFDVLPEGDLAAALLAMPPGAIKSLTKFVLQHGIERIIVSGKDTGGIILVTTVARLVSKRVTVILDAHQHESDYSWLRSEDCADFVDASPIGL